MLTPKLLKGRVSSRKYQFLVQQMAKEHCDENKEEGYKCVYCICDSAFSHGFCGADPSSDTDIARACRHAKGEFVSGDTRVQAVSLAMLGGLSGNCPK